MNTCTHTEIVPAEWVDITSYGSRFAERKLVKYGYYKDLVVDRPDGRMQCSLCREIIGNIFEDNC